MSGIPHKNSRSSLAKRLHGMISNFCLEANNLKDAAGVLDRIELLLEEQVVMHPEIMGESSFHGYSHFNDVLHLPFATNIVCPPGLRVDKSRELFSVLTRFCREEAERNERRAPDKRSAITWENYARLIMLPNNDKITPLAEAAYTGNSSIYNDVTAELGMLHAKHIISDKEYSDQFTAVQAQGYYGLVDIAISTKNKEIYSHVSSELFQLHKRGLIDDATYARQFIGNSALYASPLCNAIRSGNAILCSQLTAKLKQLHQLGFIDDATYLRQFTQKSNGTTPLQDAVISGSNDIFQAVTHGLCHALHTVSHDFEDYKSRYQAQLLLHTDDRKNLFHLATPKQSKNRPPRNLIVNALSEVFQEAFEDKAQDNIRLLYKEDHPAYQDASRDWLRQILYKEDSLSPPAQFRA